MVRDKIIPAIKHLLSRIKKKFPIWIKSVPGRIKHWLTHDMRIIDIIVEALNKAPEALNRRAWTMVLIFLGSIFVYVLLIVMSSSPAVGATFFTLPVIAFIVAFITIRRIGIKDYTTIKGKCTGADYGLQARVWRGRRIKALYIRTEDNVEYKINCRNEQLHDTKIGDTLAVYMMGTPLIYESGNTKTISDYAALEVIAHGAE